MQGPHTGIYIPIKTATVELALESDAIAIKSGRDTW